MTLAEASIKCEQLSDINLDIWSSSILSRRCELTAKFRKISREVIDAGFKIRRSRKTMPNGKVKPVFKPYTLKHTDSLEIVDVRPGSIKIKGDCTTRGLVYCLGADYVKMRDEQNRISQRIYGTKSMWNYETVWSKPLIAAGWKKITLKKKMARFNLAKLIGHISQPILTHSSHHVAAMHHGKVIDTWNSQGGRVDFVYAPAECANELKQILG